MTEVDFHAERTEREWQQLVDDFWLAATPKLFEWIGWSAALAGIEYVRTLSNSTLLGLLQGICTAALWFYFSAYFAKVKFTGISRERHSKRERFMSIVLSTLLAVGAYLLARFVASTVASHHGA